MAADRIEKNSNIEFPVEGEGEVRARPPIPSGDSRIVDTRRAIPVFPYPGESDRLPDRTTVPPSADSIPNAIDSLQGEPTIETLFSTALTPQLTNSDILHPLRFQPLLDEASQTLSSLASGGTGRSAIFLEASRVLDEERSLRRLLFLYRHALHQA